MRCAERSDVDGLLDICLAAFFSFYHASVFEIDQVFFL
jgi:hypothetical protein